MSMTAEPATAPEAVSPALATSAQDTSAAATDPVVSADPASSTEVDPFDNTEVQSFDRAYVEKLRREAADRRTAVKTYEDAFSAYTPDQREGWLALASKLAADDPDSQAEAAQIMLEVAQSILGPGSITETIETPSGEPDLGENQFLTAEQLEAKLAERERKAAIDAEVVKVQQEVTELGYKEGTADYQDLMWRAVNQHGHDLKAAHEARQADRQAVIDAYLADVEANSGVTVPRAGQPGLQSSPITDFKSARASVEARIAAAYGGGQ